MCKGILLSENEAPADSIDGQRLATPVDFIKGAVTADGLARRNHRDALKAPKATKDSPSRAVQIEPAVTLRDASYLLLHLPSRVCAP